MCLSKYSVLLAVRDRAASLSGSASLVFLGYLLIAQFQNAAGITLLGTMLSGEIR